jgi:hypothetical protein
MLPNIIKAGRLLHDGMEVGRHLPAGYSDEERF